MRSHDSVKLRSETRRSSSGANATQALRLLRGEEARRGVLQNIMAPAKKKRV
eukprot:CAMPEP_0204206230 /NCGR_PEP_ID=MMETSP0361-20130328/70904_1 /ASSEMBLY_ACC=CAM_ASM_000343 /TAXON_ID=268821 /ORGANISM="Scrippsiella Hangoei, Strain SHTV-5" /LENGTH=51 /DNA_ID=CAMNT_0051169617 /DNA_START=48 /DNA_END=200 /DNA_ORIENTATION=-